jgi:hypothetical protein
MPKMHRNKCGQRRKCTLQSKGLEGQKAEVGAFPKALRAGILGKGKRAVCPNFTKVVCIIGTFFGMQLREEFIDIFQQYYCEMLS